MGPFARLHLHLIALLGTLPRNAWTQAFNPDGAGPLVSVAISIALAYGRRFIKTVPRVAMARLAISAPGGSALSGALQAAAGGGSHALPAAASALSRRKPAKTYGRKAVRLAAGRRS